MKDNKVERARQKAMMFGRQFLQGDTDVFDQALGADAMVAVMIAQAPGCRERIYAPLDTLQICQARFFGENSHPASLMRPVVRPAKKRTPE